MKELWWVLVGVVIGFFGVVILSDPRKPCPPPYKGALAVPKCEGSSAAGTATSSPLVAITAPKKREKLETIIPPPEDPNNPRPVCSAEKVLAKMSLADLHAACAKAEQVFLTENLDDYAAPPADDSEREIWLNQLYDQIKEFVHKKGSWWHGSFDLPIGGKESKDKDKKAHIDLFFKLYGSHEMEMRDPFTSNMPAWIKSADEICYSLRTYVTVGEKTGANPSFSACKDPGRKKGESFFLTTMIGDRMLPGLLTILVPMPVRDLPKLEYLTGNAKTWAKTDFTWDQSSVGEWQAVHDKYLKSADK